jgi:hypothetical protein
MVSPPPGAGPGPPPTWVRRAMHAHVWQRLAAALEALLLLRRLVMLKDAEDARMARLGACVLETVIRRPACLLELSAALQRIAELKGAPPFVYQELPGAPTGAPQLRPWAVQFLAHCEAHSRWTVASGAQGGFVSIEALAKQARFWSKQIAHNTRQAASDGLAV